MFTLTISLASIKFIIKVFLGKMKTATLLAFLLLGLACTYAVTAEEEVTEDEPAAEDEMIENDEESENDEDEEKRAIIRRGRCRVCRKTIVYRYGVKLYCIRRCWCKGPCRYNRCYHGYACAKKLKCNRYSYPKCPY